jgi:hypothetical protein
MVYMPKMLYLEAEPSHARLVCCNLVKTPCLWVLVEEEAFVTGGLFVFAHAY